MIPFTKNDQDVCNNCATTRGQHPDCGRCEVDRALRLLQEKWLHKQRITCGGVNVAPAFAHVVRHAAGVNIRRKFDETANSTDRSEG